MEKDWEEESAISHLEPPQEAGIQLFLSIVSAELCPGDGSECYEPSVRTVNVCFAFIRWNNKLLRWYK